MSVWTSLGGSSSPRPLKEALRRPQPQSLIAPGKKNRTRWFPPSRLSALHLHPRLELPGPDFSRRRWQARRTRMAPAGCLSDGEHASPASSRLPVGPVLQRGSVKQPAVADALGEGPLTFWPLRSWGWGWWDLISEPRCLAWSCLQEPWCLKKGREGQGTPCALLCHQADYAVVAPWCP